MRISTVQPFFIMASLTEDEKFLWQSKGNFAHSMSIHIVHATLLDVRCGGLRVNVLDSGASGPVSSPGQGHCVVFLGKTLYSHSASLH